MRQLAKKLGVSPAFLSQIEAGRQHKIPKQRIVQVAEMLGVSDAYLLGTARQIHPDVVEFLRQTPEASEFMSTAMSSGLEAEDFADLRAALKDKTGKGFMKGATVSSPGKRKPTKKKSSQQLVDHLDPALCATGIAVQNKERLFQRFAKAVTKRNKSLAADDVFDRLMERERKAATMVGGGVAIPHAFMSDLEDPLIGAVSLKRWVAFNPEPEGRVKTVFFVVGNQSKPQFHISILARIARLCSSPTFLEAFANARTNRELYKIVLQWDKRIGED